MRRHGSSRRSLPELTERMLARLARGGIQSLVNWGPRLSPERSASASQIAGMVAIQTQAIFTIERHDRKFPTRVLFRRTPSLIEGFALVSVQADFTMKRLGFHPDSSLICRGWGVWWGCLWSSMGRRLSLAHSSHHPFCLSQEVQLWRPRTTRCRHFLA